MALLDRDGVLVRDVGYPHQLQDLEVAKSAIALCRQLLAAGFQLVIVTNQSGIARGLFSPSDYASFTNAMLAIYERQGVHFRAVLACPHLVQGAVSAYARPCLCRKPRPGLLVKASRRLGLTRRDAIMIGDRASDLEAAHRAGLRHALRWTLDSDGTRRFRRNRTIDVDSDLRRFARS